MSIRFQCTACQTVLKIGDMISEPKKVRCTGCGIVIVVSPDEDSPNGISASIPEQSGKGKARSREQLARQRNMLIAGAVLTVLALVGGLWWYFTPPSDRGAVEGEVTLDGQPLEKGEIFFVPIGATKGPTVKVTIAKGQFQVSAWQGPSVGVNKVEIYGKRPTGKMKIGPTGEMVEEEVEAVAARFNTNSKLEFDVKRSNTKKFEVMAR